MTAPVASATSSTTSPARTASAMLGASADAPRNAAAAHTSPTTTITAPPAASVIDTAVSNGVAKSKWDGTPRHACRVTSAVSTTHATRKAPSTSLRARSRRNDVAHATDGSVRPKESPKVAALRSDSGPIHVHPVTSSTTTCANPLVNSTPPTTYANRSTGRPSTQIRRTAQASAVMAPGCHTSFDVSRFDVFENGHRGVAAVHTDHAPARMGGGAAEVEAGHGGAGPEAPVPHLVGKAVALEDVAAGEADAGLDVGRPEDLAFDHAVAHVRREAGDLGECGVRDLLAPRLPGALREVVRDVLREDAHHVTAGRGHGRVVGRGEVHLGPRRRRVACRG